MIREIRSDERKNVTIQKIKEKFISELKLILLLLVKKYDVKLIIDSSSTLS